MTWEFNRRFVDTAIRISPAMECNYQCNYCSNGLTIPRYTRCDITSWIQGIRRIPADRFDVVSVSGGEPLLYTDLVELLNTASERWPTRVYTNLSLDPTSILRDLSRPVDWRVSVHYPCDVKKLIHHLDLLSISGKKRDLTVVMVEGTPALVEYGDLVRAAGFAPVLDENQWGVNEKTQGRQPFPVDCTNRIWLFGPDGRRYPCVRHLMAKQHAGPTLWEMDWTQAKVDVTTRCNQFGTCLACDGLINSSVVTVV